MRLNKFIAQSTGLSRRAADRAIEEGRVTVNGARASLGHVLKEGEMAALDNQPLKADSETVTLMLNKPGGYVVSRDGQGSQTIYELLPEKYHHLKPVGRLDKDSSGLLLLTNDGNMANQLTHPRYSKTKIYEVSLNKPLEPLHQQMISDHGIKLEDGPSRLILMKLADDRKCWQVSMSEGRNRQIRRTFSALGYEVVKLHRTQFGEYNLHKLNSAEYKHA